MRGEHLGASNKSFRGDGSPPHARGTLLIALYTDCIFRITPACAGNTRFASNFLHLYRDHPRMRGEHLPWMGHSCSFIGSPPHARGTPNKLLQLSNGAGITPACAGNTAAGVGAGYCGRDHPRMRGEHFSSST